MGWLKYWLLSWLLGNYSIQLLPPSDCQIRGGTSHSLSQSERDARQRHKRQRQRNWGTREERKSGK